MPIHIKFSDTAGAAPPTPSDDGKLIGINAADDKIFYLKDGVVVGRSLTPTSADVGLGNVDNTSDATKNAAAVTLTNKTISGASNTFSNIPLSAVTGAVGKYSALIGDGETTSFIITQATHGRAANATNIVDVKDATTGDVVGANTTVAPATGNVTISVLVAPAFNSYLVTIIG